MTETKIFKTEVRKVLDLVIHSLYTNKDIFLRELISNASDAIDKARFESLTNPDIAQKWKISIEIDKKAGVLKISDNGIGMNTAEIDDNIGTIAKSGTKAFLEKLSENKEVSAPELIGQFGVGFYSAFMVAEEISVQSKRAGSADTAVLWHSKGEDSYEISEGSRKEQGTEIRLKLKANNDDYFETWKLKAIIKKYSDFIEYPIHIIETDKGSQKEEAEKPVNSMKAVWMRKPDELSDDDYKQFYSHLSHFGKEALTRIHFSAEGTSNFKALVYIPAEAPPFFLEPNVKKKDLHLYIKRVFITDSCEELLPDYLRFVKGVVESEDLPLNISRETLQHNPQMEKINKNITRKILSELSSLLDKDREKYIIFHKNFGRMLKEGVNSDFQNREKILDLLLFETLKNEDGKLISLKEFVEQLSGKQEKLFFAIGNDSRALRNSPILDSVKQSGFDALLLSDPIDEYVFQTAMKYKDKSFISLNQDSAEIAINDDLSKAKKEADTKYAGALEAIKKALGTKVKDVRFSERLVSSPSCILSEQFGHSRQMEKIMKALNKDAPDSGRILELNPADPLVNAICEKFSTDKDGTALANFADTIYDFALLSDGESPSDGASFVRKISSILAESVAHKK
jgi:molecular chaperone HtpG